jgi:hypothetical protein
MNMVILKVTPMAATRLCLHLANSSERAISILNPVFMAEAF